VFVIADCVLVKSHENVDNVWLNEVSHFLPRSNGCQATELSELDVCGKSVIASTLNICGDQVEVKGTSEIVHCLEQVFAEIIAEPSVDFHRRIFEETARHRLETTIYRSKFNFNTDIYKISVILFYENY
jgi:hypothetical protein